MEVSRQLGEPGNADGAAKAAPERGPRARMRRLMLDTASRLMQGGATPSVSEVAEAAGVSRATAYRYFPSQAALVEAVVAEALGPILDWRPRGEDAKARVAGLIATAMPRIDAYEATFRAALRLTLEQWAAARGGDAGDGGKPFTRGHRMRLLGEALSPLEGRLAPKQLARLAQALSLLFGIEALVVLKDIWGIEAGGAQAVVQWAAAALVSAAEQEAGAGGEVTARIRVA